MEQRKTPRYAIDLNALVHPNVGRSWLCSIRDFCEGGMLLVEQEGNRRRSLPGIAQGENVGIHFAVPNTSGADQHFRLEGRIVRVLDSGVGIAFSEGMDDDAMTALLNHSNSKPIHSKPPAARQQAKQESPSEQEESSGAAQSRQGGSASAQATESNLELQVEVGAASGISRTDARRVIGAIRREVSRVMPEMNSAFFSYMDEELLKLARDAKSNAEQSDYFAAMSNLEKAKKKVGEAFINEVLDQIDNPRNLKALLEARKAAEQERKKQQASRVKLSLVNTEEFEDWLAVANIVSRSERVYESYLKKIHLAMGMLVDSWAHSEANPVGTAVFTHAFDNAIRDVELTKQIRQKVYSGFESKAVPLFRKLYIALIKMIEESGVFPDLDDDSFVFTGSAVTTSEPESESESEAGLDQVEEVEEEADADADSASENETDSVEDDADLRSQIADLREQLQNRGDDRGRRRPRGDGSRAGSASTARRRDIGETISSIYSTVRNLMGQVEEEDFELEEGEEAELVQLEEVQSLLSNLQQEVSGSSDRVPVRRRLQESLASTGANRRIAPAALESLGVVENLVDSIEDDKLLAPNAKDWIRQLELTLDKVATSNTDFLDSENPHESLEVINQLAQLGGSESGGIKRGVEEVIKHINDNFDSNPKVFDEAAEQLKPLVDRQSRAFTGNVQRTVKASEGQQTLMNAQRAVVSEMDTMLSGRQVPEVLLKLLMPGWRNLLVNTHLRQGRESTDWAQQVQVLEQVLEHLDGTLDPGDSANLDPQELLQQVEQGLDSIAFEPGQRAPLINSLRRFIVDGEDPAAIPRVEVAEDTVATTLGFSDVEQKDERRRELIETFSGDEDWNSCLERASHLHIGEWLEFTEQAGAQIAIVAWSSDDKSNFVFVNRRGVKTHELIIEDLASKMHEGTARILDDSEIPLTDRASHRMLQNMHNQLTHQATHDELTGLINRKEFERELARVLGLAKRSDSHHLLVYMDLDQFRVINNSAGSEGGDKLLKEIAALLKDRLSEVQVIVSRLGGNEFGLLIENCERDAGVSVTKQLCDQIKKYRFDWEDQSYSLTASCGVVVVDREVESVSSMITAADAACNAAKEAGRDRIQLYEADDQELENRRNIMEFVSQIDYAIENDRFQLNCQKIAPIDEDADHAHYEILLTVLDEDDNPLPPQDFIVAAETYNRMGAIDRWVIRNAFKFIASNILKLDDLGAFSINISGNSLTEDDFMEFVLEQFNETRLPTSKICFEITETSAIGKLDHAIDFMERMRVIGVQFSLDDFGTGLSSYSYLRSLPVDYLKIDGIFVKDIKNNPNDYAVVKSINEIGHFMGKKTIAEFVEDEEILEILREIGVDFAQGYGIERKRPIVELIA